MVKKPTILGSITNCTWLENQVYLVYDQLYLVLPKEREERMVCGMNLALQAARKKAGKTQAWLAEAAGISKTHYQNIEYGKTEPSVQTAIRIAKALKSTVEALFLVAPPPTPAREEPLTEEERAHLEYKDRLRAEMARQLARGR